MITGPRAQAFGLGYRVPAPWALDKSILCQSTAAVLSSMAVVFAGWGTARAQGPRQVTTAASASTPGRPINRTGDDSLLMLDSGPLHLRLHVALGGASLAEARRQYVAGLIESLDADKDGKLTRDEAQRSPLLRTKQRPGAAQFLEGLEAQSQLMPRDVEQTHPSQGGRAGGVSAGLDLRPERPGGLQAAWTKTARACWIARSCSGRPSLILSKDERRRRVRGLRRVLPAAAAPDPMAVAVMPKPAATTTPLPTVADLIRDAGEPLIARRLLKKYDRNRDLQLDPRELGWSKERVAELDADGNGRLDAGELATLGKATPDIELDGRSARPPGGRRADPRGRHQTGSAIDGAGRLDYAKVAFDPAVVTFSHRNLDPIAAAIESAMRQFNQLDADANGYLGRDETTERMRFERELFDLIDVDGDDKIFVDEMKQYVRAYAEPVAATCRVNVYDTGNGFFMALDANADGRVSVREMRKAAGSLAQLDRDGQSGHGPERAGAALPHRVRPRQLSALRTQRAADRPDAGLPAAHAHRADLVPADGPQQRRRPDLERVPRPA